MSGEAITILEVQRSLQKEAAKTDTWVGGTNAIFTTATGNFLSQSTVRNDFIRRCKACCIDAKHFHTFRATYATMAAEAGSAQKAVMSILGHSDERITREIYTQATQYMKNNAADATGAHIGSVLNEVMETMNTSH